MNFYIEILIVKVEFMYTYSFEAASRQETFDSFKKALVFCIYSGKNH